MQNKAGTGMMYNKVLSSPGRQCYADLVAHRLRMLHPCQRLLQQSSSEEAVEDPPALLPRCSEDMPMLDAKESMLCGCDTFTSGCLCGAHADRFGTRAASCASTVERTESDDLQTPGIIRQTKRAWPENREVRGFLRVSTRAREEGGSLEALCSISRGTLTLGVEPSKGAGTGFDTVMAQISVGKLSIKVFPGRFDMFRLGCQDEECGDIYCFATDQTARNKWIAVFRRMNIAIQAPLHAPFRGHSNGEKRVKDDNDLAPRDSFRRKLGLRRNNSEPSLMDLGTSSRQVPNAHLARCTTQGCESLYLTLA